MFLTILLFLLSHGVGSVTDTCPSACGHCTEEVVKGQSICQVYKTSGSSSDIYETEDTNCIDGAAENGRKLVTGKYEAHSITKYSSNDYALVQVDKMKAVHTATYKSSLAKAYDPVETKRSYIVKYKKGDVIYELFYGSFAYIMIIKKSKTISDLTLPDGWTSNQRTLSSDLNVYTPDDSTVLLDDLNNIYTSLHVCSFHADMHTEHYHSNLLNYVIGISFLIILCCAASFMCIRLYYIRRKKLRKRKLVKKGKKVKRYDATSTYQKDLPKSKTTAQVPQEMC